MNATQHSDVDRRLSQDPIAIVGLSALYPKARDLREFWANIVAGTDCIEDVPSTHWDVAEHYDPDPTAPDKTYSKRGGFIPTVPFSPLEFGLPPNTLEVTDVLQLLSLVVARDLLRDAGADQPWYNAGRTGVVLGVTGANQLTQPLSARLQTPLLKEVVRSCGLSDTDAEEIAAKFSMALAPWEENSFPGMLGNVVAGRIANRLDLGGINMTIDAACASSLGALKAAVSELLERRADTMMVGGCDAENTIFMYLCFSKTPAFSKAGQIRPFDKDADGTLIGEGIGMLALRRLADAERDGNRIYAVIRGIGASSDGRFKSIYAPRKEGQEVALRRAYEDADCSPASVELFEAHGTGTAVGEATELSALVDVVSGHEDERQYAAIGSVKSQIGHTKAAAGAAGMIKLALSLYHKVLPPTINVTEPNPAIDWQDSPLYVNTEARPWVRDPGRPVRRAAVSSFGFGGTNFHTVLEEYGDGDQVQVMFPVARVHLWHAADVAALARAVDDGAEPSPGPVPAEHARVAFVARNTAELAELRSLAAGELRSRPETEAWTHPKGVYFRRAAASTGKVAALFAGQGSQYVGMGLSAVLGLPPLRAAFDKANLSFQGAKPLSRIVFPPPAFDEATRTAQEEALRQTAYAQPAIGALAIGQFRYLSELGFAADGYLGHSFGELAALWAAGSIDDEGFFTLARARGAAMAPPDEPGFDPGAMAAISATDEQVGQLLAAHPGLVICNRNAADQMVVGGATDEVVRFVEAATSAGLRVHRLPVSAAFHTPLVAHAVERFTGAVAAVEVGEPRGPVYANTAGAAYAADAAANRQVLTQQLVNPVHFAERVEEMFAAGFRSFVEFGPKGVLTQLVRRILGDREFVAIQLDTGVGNESDVALKRAVAQLAVLGLPLATTDRYRAEEPAAEALAGMTVPLNGINYMPESRKAAYREALESGYRVSLPQVPTDAALPAATSEALPAIAREAPPVVVPMAHPAPVPAVPQAAPATLPSAAPAAEAALPSGAAATRSDPTGGPDSRLSELVADHLALHDEYLAGQLQSAQRLVNVLERATDQDLVAQVITGVTAVKDHGLAIGRTHLRANEVLRDLAAIELGAGSDPVARHTTPPAGPAYTAPAQPEPVAELTAEQLTRALPPVPAEIASIASTTAITIGQPAPVATPAQPAGLSVDEVRTALLDIVAEKTGYPADMLDLDMSVEADLGIDSIKRVEIMGVLQERFPAPAPVGPEQLAELRTLADIVAFVATIPTAGQPEPVAATVPSAGPSADEVRTALLDIVAEKTGYPADMLDLDMNIEADLGIDSIKRVEIMGVLQERFPAPAPVGPEQLAELRTLADIVAFIANLPTAGQPDQAGDPVTSPATVTAPLGRMHAAVVDVPAPDRLVEAYPEGATALVVDDGSALVPAVLARLAAYGWRVQVLYLPGVPRRAEQAVAAEHELSGWDDTELAGRIADIAREPIHLALLFSAADELDWPEGVRRLSHALLVAKHCVAPLTTTAATARRVAFVTVTRLDGRFGLSGVEESRVPAAGVGGLVKTLAIEEPALFCRAIDLAPLVDPVTAAGLVVDELYEAAAGPVQIGHDGTRRVCLSLADTPLEVATTAGAPTQLDSGDLLVVTGGGRGITARCVAGLAAAHRPGLLLLGRTELRGEPDWAQGIAGNDLKAAAAGYLTQIGEKPTPKRVEELCRPVVGEREIREVLAEVAAVGSEVEYLSADITDAAATAAALAPYAERITGLVHGAGVLADQFVSAKQPENIESVFAPKLAGLQTIVNALPAERLRHLVLFSSAAGFFGNRGQSDYAMANEVLNAWASSWKRHHPQAHVTAVNWGAWDSGMVSPQLKTMFEERGITLIPVDVGARMFTEQFDAERAADVVTVVGPTTPLSEREPAAPASALVIERNFAELVADPIVADHVIGHVPVLPAAVALGWAIGAVERITGGSVSQVHGFAVHKGVIFDGEHSGDLRLEAGATQDGLVEVAIRSVAADGAIRPHYAARVMLDGPEPLPRPAALTGVPALTAGDDASHLYTDGTLFHGESLRGIRRVLASDESRLILGCALEGHRPAGGAFHGARYAPGATDVLLQAGLVWMRLFRDTATLPLFVGRIDLYDALSDGEPFVVLVEPTASNETGATVTVTASGPDGRVLTQLSGLSLVSTPQLAAKFASR
ncbi:SDR family NAD(P)-dependent oxidoreductase [Kribbella sp. NPDC050124]|uniref:SDR family NAD(P)-dependent oxidoreductase n=1 Tax=Kribbella sp. NPDC050124 TaxID=3364114 RepID=UPI003790C910